MAREWTTAPTQPTSPNLANLSLRFFKTPGEDVDVNQSVTVNQVGSTVPGTTPQETLEEIIAMFEAAGWVIPNDPEARTEIAYVQTYSEPQS